MSILNILDRLVGRLCRWGVISGLIIVFGLLLVSILARPFSIQVSGYDEIVELCFIWITMLGVIELWRTDKLYRVEFLDILSRNKPSARAALVQLLMLIFLGVLIYKGGQYALFTNESTAFMRMPKIYFYAAIPISGAIMSIYSLSRLLWHLHGLLMRPKPEGVTAHYPSARAQLSTEDV